MPSINFFQFVENELSEEVASKIYKVQQATGMTAVEVVGNIVEKWVEDWDDDDEWKTSY